MKEFDLDKKGYLSICEKGAFDMVDAEIILTPNEVDELKKALTINVVGSHRGFLDGFSKWLKSIVG